MLFNGTISQWSLVPINEGTVSGRISPSEKVHETRSDTPTGIMYDSQHVPVHHDANTCEGVENPRYWFVYEFCKNTICTVVGEKKC